MAKLKPESYRRRKKGEEPIIRLHVKDREKYVISKAKEQGNKCPVCLRDLGDDLSKKCLDHDHKSGFCRDILCVQCNGFEGKLKNMKSRMKNFDISFEEFIKNIHAYWGKHVDKPSNVFHWKHKTKQDKKDRARAKAKANRLKKIKEQENNG